MGFGFYSFDYTLKTILLNVLPSPYSVETLIGSSAATKSLKLSFSVCNLPLSLYHIQSKSMKWNNRSPLVLPWVQHTIRIKCLHFRTLATSWENLQKCNFFTPYIKNPRIILRNPNNTHKDVITARTVTQLGKVPAHSHSKVWTQHFLPEMKPFKSETSSPCQLWGGDIIISILQICFHVHINSKQACWQRHGMCKIHKEWNGNRGAAHLKSPSWYLPKACRMMVMTAMMGLTTQNWRVAWRTHYNSEWDTQTSKDTMKEEEEDIRICLYI